MRKFKEWSEADTITLDKMIKEGYGNKIIAQTLARQESYISAKRKELGYKIKYVNYWSEEDTNQLRKLYYEGYSDEKIAELLNRSAKVIKQYRNKKGLADMSSATVDWEEKYIQKYFINQLLSCESMAQAVFKTGITREIINRKIKQFFKSNIISKNIYKELQNKLYKRRIRFD